jgi:hypothetical protein
MLYQLVSVSTFNQNHPNHRTVFGALGNTVTNLVSKQHLEAQTVALVAELLSRTAMQGEPRQGALRLRPCRQEVAAVSGQEEKM